jgi:hypothetical protein
MQTRSPFLFSSLLALCLAACGSASPADTDGSSEDAIEADAAPDAVYIANAKSFFEALVNENTNRDSARITYAELPQKLAKPLEKNNPDPNAEWAAEAYRTKVKNARGHMVLVYGIMDGIDDEGESITLYTSSSRQFAEGDDYRGFVWNN